MDPGEVIFEFRVQEFGILVLVLALVYGISSLQMFIGTKKRAYVSRVEDHETVVMDVDQEDAEADADAKGEGEDDVDSQDEPSSLS